jgi:hypothetical protein
LHFFAKKIVFYHILALKSPLKKQNSS